MSSDQVTDVKFPSIECPYLCFTTKETIFVLISYSCKKRWFVKCQKSCCQSCYCQDFFEFKKKQQEGDPSVNMKKFGKNADSKVNKFKGGFHQQAGTRWLIWFWNLIWNFVFQNFPNNQSNKKSFLLLLETSSIRDRHFLFQRVPMSKEVWPDTSWQICWRESLN